MARRESTARRRAIYAVLAAAVVTAAIAAAVLVVAARDDEPVAAGEEQELRIGLVTSFTGDLSTLGPPIDQSARLAVEVFNEAAASAGSRLRAVLVAVEDDRTEAASGVEAARKLVTVDGIDVLIGSTPSAVTGPIAEEVTVPASILQISPASTASGLTELADEGLLWRTVPTDVLQVDVLVDAVAAEFGADATINVGARDDAYGRAMADAFTANWNAGGGAAPGPVLWDPLGDDFTSIAERMVAGNPDGWVVIDFPRTFASVGEALLAAGWEPSRTFAADGLRNTRLVTEAGPEVTEGLRGTAPAWEGGPAADAFARLFADRATPGIAPEAFSAQTFDAVLLAGLAALRAGSTDPSEIKDHLVAVSAAPGAEFTFEDLEDAVDAVLDGDEIDYQGASGAVNLDARGDVTSAHYEVWQLRNGVLETLRTQEVGR